MNLSQNVNITTAQKLTISPQLQHAIKLLQMSNIELIEKIENEIAENPFLDEVLTQDKKQSKKNEERKRKKNNDDKTEPIKPDANGISKEKIDRDTIEYSFDDSSDTGYARKEYEPRNDDNDKQSFLEGTIATTETIYDHLISELHLADSNGSSLNEDDYLIAEMIITSLDTDGLLKTPLEEIANSAEVSVSKVEEILTFIQQLDPPGIAARDFQEALIIQIERDEEPNELAKEIIKHYIRLLENKKYKDIASKLGVTIDDVREAELYISKLEPYPARAFDTTKVKYIVPDIFVTRSEEGFDIMINDEFIPHIKLNTKYRKMSREETPNVDAKKFLDNKYSEAKLLIFSLEKRRDTIFKVVKKIVELQEEFFDKGPKFLRPLVLRDVAEELDMHESTVSRVTTDKYMSTPWGTFELKYFFSSGIRKSSGELKSSTSIKEIIRQIIENEPDNKTLSDQKIVEILKNQGIKIARRTVAKYRKSLQIFPSYQRKKV